MLSPLGSALMFMGSFAPLFALFAIRTHNRALRWSLVGIAVAGVTATLTLIWIGRRTEPAPIHLTRVRPRDAEVVSYLVTYLLPFLLAPDPSGTDIVALVLFLCVIAILYIRSNMVYVNPVLALLGWHLFAAETESNVLWILSRRSDIKSENIQAVNIVGNVWIRREDRE